MSLFLQKLTALDPAHDPAKRRWLYIPYDQLTDALGPLSREQPDTLGIILIESLWKGKRRPYHKQKLAWILANQRQFALEQAARGVAVRYHFTHKAYAEILEQEVRDLAQCIRLMRPAERELRQNLEPLVARGDLEILPHEGWLTDEETFLKSQGKKKSWRMDAFYREVRKKTGILMEDGSPEGGKYSHDADNRQPWKGDPPAPTPPRFDHDEITTEVGELIEAMFADHPGTLDLARVPATRQHAEEAWSWSLRECMEHFGPYEDAMSTRSRTLFHTLLSPLVNLHRITPKRALEDVLALELPLNSKEGFVRQLIGWREFMRHVHEQTDGLRRLPGRREDPEEDDAPGDAGWAAYREGGWERSSSRGEGGARPSFLGAERALPAAFWGERSGLHCLDHVVEGVMETGYSHHIERLMILGNLATLLDISPRHLTDWFWVAYIDAYDWVVEPNVLGMATFGVGDLFTTKPYVAGSNYINKMSDFCKSCAFNPRTTCPVTNLYWAFLDRHADMLSDNLRMGLVYKNLERRGEEQRALDASIFEVVIGALEEGRALAPKDLKDLSPGS
ncbi:MAG: cryptochrome/photolyase family protein [Myxococcota bacterium]|nr:cryptochrome/photolyase family protein [Myxococcota bacterium]